MTGEVQIKLICAWSEIRPVKSRQPYNGIYHSAVD